jgi:hypothetical protein
MGLSAIREVLRCRELINYGYGEHFHYNEQTINTNLIAVDIKTGQKSKP